MNHRIIQAGLKVLPLAALTLVFAVPMHAQDAATLFKTKCAACHGADGAGATSAGKATKVHPFCSDDVLKQTDAEWTTVIVKGKNKMPSYDKKLTDAQIKDLVAYIRHLCKT